MECDKCLNEQRIFSLEESARKNTETHEKFYTNLESLRTTNAVREERDKSIDKSLNMIVESQGALKAIVSEIQSRPAKEIEKQVTTIKDKIIDKTVTFVILAVGFYIMYLLK